MTDAPPPTVTDPTATDPTPSAHSALASALAAAIAARTARNTSAHDSAYRLCNGFSEGLPTLALDIYGTSLVVHDYGDRSLATAAVDIACAALPWVEAVLYKDRNATETAARNGVIIKGEDKKLTKKIRENDTWYAVSLALNRDASLYLDTRELRLWAKQNLAGKRVLNTFAYTGSIGVAARAAPAGQVIQTDRDRAFLFMAKDSYAMNGFDIRKEDFRTGDFFTIVSQLKKESALFDCVFLDPPFFSMNKKDNGRVDVEQEMEALINKLRPLVGDGGWLVAVNNGLFVSGQEFHAMLEKICAQGYASIESLVPVPDDFIGGVATWPTDPAPFNHPTKIAVLRMRRKDGRKASQDQQL